MRMTLEKRVEAVEKKVAVLAKRLVRSKRGKKDWRTTVGRSKTDLGFEEMIQLGRAYREGLRNGGNRAHS